MYERYTEYDSCPIGMYTKTFFNVLVRENITSICGVTESISIYHLNQSACLYGFIGFNICLFDPCYKNFYHNGVYIRTKQKTL